MSFGKPFGNPTYKPLARVAKQLAATTSLAAEGQFLALVDGSGLLSRPGPRVIDGIGLLAELFDPEGLGGAAPPDSWIPLGPGSERAGRGR